MSLTTLQQPQPRWTWSIMHELAYYRKKDAAPQPPLLDTPFVTITISNRTASPIWEIHKNLLCRYSDYFQAALESDMQEGNTQRVELENEDPHIVSLMYYWLYSGSIRVGDDVDSQGTLVKLWLFADRRGMPALQNYCLDALHQLVINSRTLDDAKIIRPIFESAPPSAGIRNWIANIYPRLADISCLTHHRPEDSSYPSDFLYRLAQKLFELNAAGPQFPRSAIINLDTCQYHEHEEGKSCAVLSRKDEEERNEPARSVKRTADWTPKQ